MSWQNAAAGEKKQKNKSRVAEGDRKKKKILPPPKKGLENDTIVKDRNESGACSAQYQHNTVERKAPI